jgi:hypothetical protein
MEPVKLEGLAPVDRILTAVALLVAAFWCALFIAAAAGWTPGAGTGFGWMASSWPAALTRIMTYASLGLAGVLGVRAAVGWDSWLRRGVLVVVALVLYYVARGSTGYSTTHGSLVTVTRLLGDLGVVLALLLVVLPLNSPGLRRAAVALVALGSVIPLVNLLLAGQLTRPWRALVDVRSDALWRAMLSLQIFFVLYLFWNLVTWARLLGQWSKSTGELIERGRTLLLVVVAVKLAWELIGVAGSLPTFLGGSSPAWAASRNDGWASWLTAALLAAIGGAWLWRRAPKAEWATSETEAPSGVEAPSAPEDGSGLPPPDAAHEPPESDPAPLPATEHLLLFAAVLAAPAIVAALLQMRPTAVDVRSPTAQLVIAGAVALAMATGWNSARGHAYRVLFAVGAGALVAAAAYSARLSLAPNEVTGHYLLAPLAAFGLAAWVCWREGNRSRPTARQRSRQLCAAAFCALLAGVVVFHVAPRLRQIPFPFDSNSIGAAGDQLLDPTMAAAQYRDVAPSWERWWRGAGGTFEPVTLDVAVTVTVGLLLIESRRRRRPAPSGLAAVVVASSIYAHSATLSPTAWAGHAWFYLAFAFPVVMTVVVDARELNTPHPQRGRRLVGSLAAILFLITVAGWSLLSSALSPAVPLADRTFGFTRGLSLSFFLAAMVAAVVAGAIDPATVAPARPGHELAGGIGVGQREV